MTRSRSPLPTPRPAPPRLSSEISRFLVTVSTRRKSLSDVPRARVSGQIHSLYTSRLPSGASCPWRGETRAGEHGRAAIAADQDDARDPDTPRWSHAEFALLRRAGRPGEMVPDEVKAKAVDHLARPLRTPATSARERVRGGTARVSGWAVACRAHSRVTRVGAWCWRLALTRKPPGCERLRVVKHLDCSQKPGGFRVFEPQPA